MSRPRSVFLGLALIPLLSAARARASETDVEKLLLSVDPRLRVASETQRADGRKTVSTAVVLQVLKQRAGERIKILNREKKYVDVGHVYLRVENFARALPLLSKLAKSIDLNFDELRRQRGQQPEGGRTRGGRGNFRDRFGMFERLANLDRDILANVYYARALTYRNRSKQALQVLDRIPEVPQQARARVLAKIGNQIENARSLTETFPASKPRVAELVKELAKTPDAEKQKELIRLCDPEGGDAQLALTWLKALLDMNERHNDDKYVVEGEIELDIVRAFDYHDLWGLHAAQLASMIRRFPDFELTTDGTFQWQLAESLYEFGKLQKSLRRRGSVPLLQQAQLVYGIFKAAFPDHENCREQERSPAERIQQMIQRFRENPGAWRGRDRGQGGGGFDRDAFNRNNTLPSLVDRRMKELQELLGRNARR